MIVAQCEGCVRVVGGECMAFESPLEMWADGPCLAYTRNRKRVENAQADIELYSRIMAEREAERIAQSAPPKRRVPVHLYGEFASFLFAVRRGMYERKYGRKAAAR